MSIDNKEILQKLSDAVVEMDEDEVIKLSHEIVAEKIDAYEAIDQGLSHGMEKAGKLFEDEEYFIPELLLCSDAMYAGLDILKPHLKANEEEVKYKVVIGVVEGDTHDIGKNLVKIMLETSGFEIFDLGRDISPQNFIDKAKEVNADIIALATLMTTTMDAMSEVIQLLRKENIKEHYKVIIGGGPISQNFADKIGADGYASNAADAVKIARKLVNGPIEIAV